MGKPSSSPQTYLLAVDNNIWISLAYECAPIMWIWIFLFHYKSSLLQRIQYFVPFFKVFVKALH